MPPNKLEITRKLVKSQLCCKRNGHSIFLKALPPSNVKCLDTSLVKMLSLIVVNVCGF